MKLLFIVDSMLRHKFFLRLANSLRNENSIYFASSEPMSIFSARMHGYKAIHFARNDSEPIDKDSIFNLTAGNSIEVLNKQIDIDDAARDLRSIFKELNFTINKFNIDILLIWNGQQLLGRAATLAAKECNVCARYLEISNLPNKLFVDPLGVNSLSSISNDVTIIDNLPAVNNQEHATWMHYFEDQKRKPLPQSVSTIKNKLVSAVNYLFKLILSSTCTSSNRYVFSRVNNPKPFYLDENESEMADYVFLPLQVSTDTQIKLHSNFDNIKIIDYAVEMSKKHGFNLVVKVHPAEKSKSEIERVLEKKRLSGFIISNRSTVDLIKNSKYVITINSTVGLEALMYEKKVVILGSCFYKKFNNERLLKYIHRYLIEGVDYFSDDEIPSEVAKKIIGFKS